MARVLRKRFIEPWAGYEWALWQRAHAVEKAVWMTYTPVAEKPWE